MKGPNLKQIGPSELTTDLQIASALLIRCCDTDLLLSELHALDLYLPLQGAFLELDEAESKKLAADSLVCGLNADLLSNRVIRERVAEFINIHAPDKWRAGGAQEALFCRSAGLPDLFAGSHDFFQWPPLEFVNSRPSALELLPFQQELRNKALRSVSEHDSGLISIPTGAGKTLVASKTLASLAQAKKAQFVIWLAHTEELCEQALDSIKKVWHSSEGLPPLSLLRAWGGYKAKLLNSSVVSAVEREEIQFKVFITTPQTFRNLLDKSNLEETALRGLNTPDLIIVDEAHRAAASSYKNIIDEIRRKRCSADLSVLGLTATPIRNSFSERASLYTLELRQIFGQLIEPSETFSAGGYRENLIKDGVLSMASHFTANTNTLKDSARYIEKAYRSSKSARPALAFCKTIGEAQALATLLVRQGLSALPISNRTSRDTRRWLLQKLANGDLDIICNCEILTTGYDLPGIDKIYILRDMKSYVLYLQIVGRALRGPRFGGTKKAEIHTVGAELEFPLDVTSDDFSQHIWA